MYKTPIPQKKYTKLPHSAFPAEKFSSRALQRTQICYNNILCRQTQKGVCFMVKIITDSICDLDPHYLAPYNVDMMPLRVRLGEKEYLDKVDIDYLDVCRAMEQGTVPKSTQVPADIMSDTFEKYAAAGQDFIYVAFSSVLSGCCSLAEMMTAELRERYPNVRMGVINSKAGAGGMGLIVLQLAHMAKAGASFEKLIAHGAYLSEHIVHMIALRDLKWLVLGGRINKLLGATAGALDVRPLVHIDKEGYLKAFGTARGQKRMVQTICDKALEKLKTFPEQLVAVCYTYEQESCHQAIAYLKEKLPQIKIVLQPVGSVLTTYLGLSGVGILFFDERPQEYYFD